MWRMKLVKLFATILSGNWYFNVTFCYRLGSLRTPARLLDSSTVVAQRLALFAQHLRMNFRLIRHIQSVRFLQRALFVWIDIDVALDALLTMVGPRIARHPLSLALRTLVLAEAALLALVRCFAFRFRASLRTVSNVVTLLEAQMAKIVGRRHFAILQVRVLQVLLLHTSGVQRQRLMSSVRGLMIVVTRQRQWCMKMQGLLGSCQWQLVMLLLCMMMVIVMVMMMLMMMMVGMMLMH